MNIPCKLLSPPVLVDSTRFSLYAVTEVSRKPKHTHFKYRFQNTLFMRGFPPIRRGDGAPGVRLGQGSAMEMQSSPWRSAAECKALVRAPEDLAKECDNTRRRGSADSRRPSSAARACNQEQQPGYAAEPKRWAACGGGCHGLLLVFGMPCLGGA